MAPMALPPVIGSDAVFRVFSAFFFLFLKLVLERVEGIDGWMKEGRREGEREMSM